METCRGKRAVAIRFLYIDQNNIRSDLTDIFITNCKIPLAVDKIQPFITARHNDFMNLSAAFVKLQVTNASQFLTVPDIDDLFPSQLTIGHATPS